MVNVMNLPGFKKGDVLRAAELQALSDAVARFREAGRAVAAAGGAAAWQNELRTPIQNSGDARLALGFDNPDGEVPGKPLATGYGYMAGVTTQFCEMRGTEQSPVERTDADFVGPLWQTLCIDKVGRVINKSGVYAGEPKKGRWWGEASPAGDESASGQLTFLLGCVRPNTCSGTRGNAALRRYFRRHQQLPVPHITVNACLLDACTVPLVKKHKNDENVSRVRRLKAGENVQLELCEDFVRVSACSGGGLRPVNPPGVCCGEDAPSGDCSAAGGCCELPRPVPMVGCEWPAGAPTGVIVRALVGGAAARVRRSCCACAVEVVVPRVQNADEVCGCLWLAGTAVRPVTCCALHSCCAVPLRVLEVGAGLHAQESARSARLWVEFPVAAVAESVLGDEAEPGVDGWEQTFLLPGPKPVDPELLPCWRPCWPGARRQLMRYYVSFPEGALQVAEQVLDCSFVWRRIK